MISLMKVSIFALAASVMVSNVSAGKDWNCKGEKPIMATLDAAGQACAQEIGEVQDPNAKTLKMSVCSWEKQGVLLNNNVSEEGFKSATKMVFPINGQAVGDFMYTTCVTNAPSNVANLSKDNNCKSYGPLIQCVFAKLHEYCGDQ